ncbi:MAG TPA: hypothetical protein VKE51_02775 [Vicinamibacterales bacterium]|nr:hypothetical protein [Vicinamibacterales bacterium]
MGGEVFDDVRIGGRKAPPAQPGVRDQQPVEDVARPTDGQRRVRSVDDGSSFVQR